MKTVSFKYTKSASDVTNRIGFVLSKPAKNYSILEVLEGEDDIDAIESALQAEYARHNEVVKELSKKFNLGFKYFAEDKISDIQEL